MNALEAQVEYMKAVICAKTPGDVDKWPLPRVFGVFNLIDDVGTDFKTWLARMAYTLDEDVAEEAKALNAAAIVKLKSLGANAPGSPVKIVEEKEKAA